jgi:hypothetical protein
MIKVYPIKPLSYSGDASEDLIALKDKFQTAAMDNKTNAQNNHHSHLQSQKGNLD